MRRIAAVCGAGHSVRVCLLVYARCISGGDEAARRRIDAALAAESETVEVSPTQKPADSHPRPIRSQPETTGLDRTPLDITLAEPEPTTGPELEL
ncbi:hypothetical protein [Frankia sp. AvcI1]|uniref:hypothetical protein n=1 Tax=Frankia sp. AvcI1 TaxID=573496 RepID=UPI0006EBFCF4|nr:hypothetical protein [Frankia sp. AvcI1]